eukprot:477749-Pyramimonas_sp.AAC.1
MVDLNKFDSPPSKLLEGRDEATDEAVERARAIARAALENSNVRIGIAQTDSGVSGGGRSIERVAPEVPSPMRNPPSSSSEDIDDKVLAKRGFTIKSEKEKEETTALPDRSAQ